MTSLRSFSYFRSPSFSLRFFFLFDVPGTAGYCHQLSHHKSRTGSKSSLFMALSLLILFFKSVSHLSWHISKNWTLKTSIFIIISYYYSYNISYYSSSYSMAWEFIVPCCYKHQCDFFMVYFLVSLSQSLLCHITCGLFFTFLKSDLFLFFFILLQLGTSKCFVLFLIFLKRFSVV